MARLALDVTEEESAQATRPFGVACPVGVTRPVGPTDAHVQHDARVVGRRAPGHDPGRPPHRRGDVTDDETVAGDERLDGRTVLGRDPSHLPHSPRGVLDLSLIHISEPTRPAA